ncbi:MAG: hypothetical protein JWN31_1808 [Frankiales bacterium]|nr:hypothetical protein [Frankiales bacterium]
MAERTPRRQRLDQPVQARSGLPRPHYDPEAFGRLSERIARFLGTSRFLVYLTSFVVVWIGWNLAVTGTLRFDSYSNKFTLLTLILSLQASYAAPLILLAQNRQADRDRISQEEDRTQNERLQADVEYLTRELAALRLSLGEVATRDFLRDQLRDLSEEIIARTSEGDYDQEAKEQREERDKRAERKRRRDERPEPGNTSLSSPFTGDASDG